MYCNSLKYFKNAIFSFNIFECSDYNNEVSFFIRVASFPKSPSRRLQDGLVVPMGTQSWHKKFERARMHARLPLGHQSFSTMAK